MKKTLLQWNLFFLIIQTTISIWWLGFQYGRCYAGFFDGVLFVIVPLALLGIHIVLFADRELIKAKTFGIVGALNLVWAVFLLIFCVNPGSLRVLLEDYVCMIAMGVVSLLSSVFYFYCAWINKQESGEKP